MQALLSRVEFAQLCGITPQAIHGAIKKERVHLTRGRVDPEHPTNRHYREQTRNRSSSSGAGGGTEAAGRPRAGPKPPGAGRSKARSRNGLSEFVSSQIGRDETGDPDTAASYQNRVNVAKGLEQMKALKLKNERERNELISRELVRRVFAELYTIETSEFLTMAEKLSPEIASLFGIDDSLQILEVGKLIQREISTTLEHIEVTVDNFLKSFQVEDM